MSFWDRVKEFFGDEDGGSSNGGGGGESRSMEELVKEQLLRFTKRGALFVASDILAAIEAEWELDDEDRREVPTWVEEHFQQGLLRRASYSRAYLRTATGQTWVYHLVGDDPKRHPQVIASSTTPSRPASSPSTSSSSSSSASRSTSAAGPKEKKEEKKKVWKNPFDVTGGIMSLSPEELRARALKVVPWRTAWIGRIDVIPPRTDERTALVDRGLILRGFFTEEEIDEIHRIGDLWLKFKDKASLALALARGKGEQAVRAFREEKQRAKERRKKEAAEKKKKRAEQIARRRAEDIVFLGRGFSGGLADRRARVERLIEAGLPVLSAPADVAEALGLSIGELRFLAFHSEAARRVHYATFTVPKRSGGERRLSAPLPKLKAAQAWIHEQIVKKLPTEAPAHGFVSGRSTATNARLHRGRDVVLNLDLADFFPTITFPRVRGVFEGLGYSKAAATILALLCTEAPREELRYAGERYHVATGPRALPQGACTSPGLSNQIAKKLDRRLRGLAETRGFTYSRYADDLTFSAPAGKRGELGRLMASIRHIVEEEGFALNPKKGRVQRRGGRQLVNGLVVNEADKLGLPREEVRRLRAILHNAKKTGLEAQNRAGHPHFVAHLRGKIAYLGMVDRAKADRLSAELEALLQPR